MKIAVLKLRPTQFSVGMEEVRQKAAKLRKLSRKGLDDLLESRPVPIVKSRAGDCFIVDRHHFTRAAWEAGVEKVFVETRADLTHLSETEFWQAMAKCRFAHLYDQLGRGPLPPSALPDNVRGLADDPYRSLAWAVRRTGGYEKSGQPFSDFYWANYFRKRLVIGRGEAEFKAAVAEALTLARAENAFRAAVSKTIKSVSAR
jgi:hypothetical protein